MNDRLAKLMECVKRNPHVRLANRAIITRTNGYPNWREMLKPDQAEWEKAVSVAKSGKNVLVATSTGFYLAATAIESLLAAAMTLRGANAHFLLCDGILPACLNCDSSWYSNPKRFADSGPQTGLCKHCFAPAYKVLKSMGLTVHKYSDYLAAADYAKAESLGSSMSCEEIEHYRLEGLAVGEHALAGALRFFARATLDDEPTGEAVLRRYFKAALLTAYAMKRVITETRYDVALFHHGIYVPQGIIGEIARRDNIRVVNWHPAYRKQRFIFSHDDTYHHTLMTEPVAKWEDVDLTEEREAEVVSYLKSRWKGTQDWIWFHEKPRFDIDFAKEIGLSPDKPCIGMLTNVMWDAQLHYPANAFPSMLDWVLETIRYFAKRPDLQLVMRVHPAEIRGTLPSLQPIVAEIEKAFPTLPDNVFVIPPESSISTYVAMQMCDSVIIYGTKMGIELTSMGVPTIVAGEAWIRNKGVTMDASSKADYFRILDQLPLGSRLDRETVKRARKYAYHFFFRRMIPLDIVSIQKVRDHLSFQIQSKTPSLLDDLKPGRNKGLDVICNGILQGSDFIYPEESLDGLRGKTVLGCQSMLSK